MEKLQFSATLTLLLSFLFAVSSNASSISSCQVNINKFLDSSIVSAKSKEPFVAHRAGDEVVKSYTLIQTHIEDKAVDSLLNIFRTINEKFVKASRNLLVPKDIRLLINKNGQAAFFIPGQEKIKGPAQFSSTLPSYLQTPKNKKFKKMGGEDQIEKQSDKVKKYNDTIEWAKNSVPKAIGTIKEYSKHPAYSESIWAHEYGHAIFKKNLYESFPLYREYMDLFVEYFAIKKKIDLTYKKALKKLLKELESLDKTHPEVLLGGEEYMTVESVTKRWGEALVGHELEYAELFKENPFYFFEKQLTGYNELFADLTAVMLKGNDPKAISDALSITRKTQEYKKFKIGDPAYRDRDFSFKGNDISKWDMDSSDSHIEYTPTRYFLYERYLKMPYYKNPENAVRLYETVFEAIKFEVNFRIENPDLMLDTVGFNQRLIDTIKKLTIDWP